MSDVEGLLARVWDPGVRPLIEEAWRCYNAGAIRASIAATWTAVGADVIGKLSQLAETGDPAAGEFRDSIAAAQRKGVTADGVRAMQQIEATLLTKAVEFELIDTIAQRELERIREDRNLCVHPSLRNLSEVYLPRSEVARGHLAVALSTLLTHPPVQGQKAVAAFVEYTCDAKFVPAIEHIQAVFFDQVRSGARANIAKLAAKHALRELDTDGQLPAREYADRCAIVLDAFARRDRALVADAIASQRTQFQALDGDKQIRALGRLGSQDYFWEAVDEATSKRLEQLLESALSVYVFGGSLDQQTAAAVATVRKEYARRRLTLLERLFDKMPSINQMDVVSIDPDPYFVPYVIRFLHDATNFRDGERAGRLLLRHAPFLGSDDLKSGLAHWAENTQCRRASDMPQLAIELFGATRHITDQLETFGTFLSIVQSKATPEDDYYRYPGLTSALGAAGFSLESQSSA